MAPPLNQRGSPRPGPSCGVNHENLRGVIRDAGYSRRSGNRRERAFEEVNRRPLRPSRSELRWRGCARNMRVS